MLKHKELEELISEDWSGIPFVNSKDIMDDLLDTLKRKAPDERSLEDPELRELEFQLSRLKLKHRKYIVSIKIAWVVAGT